MPKLLWHSVKKNIQHDKPFTELPQSAVELGSACSSVIPTTKLKIFYTILSTIPHIVQDITHACKRYLFISIILFDRNKTQPRTSKTSQQRLAYH